MPTWDEVLGKTKKLSWKDVLSEFKPEQTRATESLGQAPTTVPMEFQMQGPTARKYGMDFDPNMYISDELPDLSTEKPEDEVLEKVHKDYHVSNEAQRAIDESASKQPIYSQGGPDRPPRIDPELLQPGAAEYLVDKLSNESLMGKASILLTGTIMAGIHGGNPIDYYRDIYDANNKTIMSYKPNELQDMATGALAVIADLPVFTGTGSLYNAAGSGAIKASTQYLSDQMVKAGMTRALADGYAKNSIVQLNVMLQTGTVLGTHAELNDIATQVAEGTELGDINWDQAMSTGGKSFVIGFGVGAFGVGANYIKNTPGYQRIVDGAVNARLVERGFGAASFTGEVGVFTVGEAITDGDRRWHDVTKKEFVHAATTILSLKGMHSRQRLPESRGMFGGAETEAIRKHVKNFDFQNPLKSVVGTEGALEKIWNDRNVPYSTKLKIADAAGVEAPVPMVTDVNMITDARGVRVETRDSKGMLVQVERFASPSDAHRFFSDIETGISEMSKVQEAATLKPSNKVEFDRALEKAGIEKGISNEKLVEAVQQLPSMRSAEQKKLANKFYETYENYVKEKTEVKEGEVAEKIFSDKPSPEMSPTLASAGDVLAAAKEKVTPYTEKEIDMKFEPNDRLQTKISHPENGIDRMLSDLQKIRETKDYKEGRIRSKMLRNYFPVESDRMGIKSPAELKAAEKTLKDAKKEIESELTRRVKAGEPAIAKGNFVMGRQAFETRGELFAELEKFPSLQNTLPEVYDFDTMLAIKDYEAAKKGKAGLAADEMRTIANKLRQAKIDPKQAMATIPGVPQGWNLAVEMAAKAVEGGASITEAVGKAIDSIRSQSFYTRMSDIEKKRYEKDVMDRFNTTLQERTELADKYITTLEKLKAEHPGKFWSVDMPSKETIEWAAMEGRLVDTGSGMGIVMPDGDMIGIFKYDPTAKGVAKGVQELQMKLGGDRLDVFDVTPEGSKTSLVENYEKQGLKVISKIPFDLEQAPKDIPEWAMKQKPDVVFMGKGDIPKEFLNQEFKSYEDAIAYRNAMMEKFAKKPSKTAAQKKIDQEFRRPISKQVVNEYTGLKEQIKGQAKIAKDIDKFRKQAQADIQTFISTSDFQKNMGARTSKTIARKLAGMDVNDPGSVIEVMDYIDRAISDSKFRQELAEMDRNYEKLDKQTAPESYQKKEAGVQKGKGIDPAYQDKLKDVRQNMLEGDWKKAQTEIDRLQEEIAQMNPGDPLIDAHLAKIEDLAFHGILNKTSNPSLEYLKGRVEDIESIRKQGRTLGAAKRFFRSSERAERVQGSFDVLNAGKRKVILDPERAANLKVPFHRRVSRWFDWSNLDSWFTLLDKMSRFDKSTGPFNSYLSKTMSEPIFKAEREEFLGSEAQFNKTNSKLVELYGTDTPKKLQRVLDKNTKPDLIMKWGVGDKSQSLPISMNQAYKRWMELQDPSLKPSLTKQGYFDQLGERTAKYDALEGILSPEARKWAEWQLNEFYPEYHKVINEVYRDIYGTDMPIRDQYSPIFIADKILSSDAAIDQMFSSNDIRGMAGNNHLKLRTKHAKELLLLDGDQVMMNYINKMEFFRNWAQPLREMNQVFGERSIRESIRQNFGQDYVDAVDFFLKKGARDYNTLNKFEKVSNKIRTNFTIGSLAIKPTVFTKQLTSFPAFADRIPIAAFIKGMADWANPGNWNKVMKLLNDSPSLQERYKKGWDRDVVLAMQRDAKSILAGKGGNANSAMMFLTRYGDKGAIMLGGWPVYKYHRNQGLKKGLPPEEAHQVGLREFEFAFRQSQQATGPWDLSIVQNSNPIMKWATMYKTSPLQYHRKVVTATRDIIFDHRNPRESAKTLLIYHAILPQLFQLVGNGFQWDGEDQLRALKWGSATGVPMAGDALRGMVNHLTNTGYEYQPTVLSDLFKETGRAADEIIDIATGDLGLVDEITFDDVWDGINHLSKAIGSWTGTPTDAVQNTVSGVADAIQGETNYPARRILGWSEYALDDDRYDLLRDLPADIRKKIEGEMSNQKKSWDEVMEENPTSWDDVLK